MAFKSEFIPIELSDLGDLALKMKACDARFVQVHAVNSDNGVDLYYSFMKEGTLYNYRVAGVTEDQSVPSITGLFLAAFVFENEARELFGVDIRDIAIDFGGHMYDLAEKAPMTFMSPEQKAAKDKAAKVAAAAAAKAASQAKAAEQGSEDKGAQAVSESPKHDAGTDASLEAKLAGMDPEKAAKVRAAMEAKKKREEAQAQPTAEAQEQLAEEAKVEPGQNDGGIDAALEAKLAGMDPEKAAKVRAAMAAKRARESMNAGEGE